MQRRNFIQKSAVGGLMALVPFKLSAEWVNKDLLPDITEENDGYLTAFSTDNVENEIYILSNFHPASCGWLTDFSTERVYCANSYLDHLDKVDNDQDYKFVISEVNNMIAIKNFRPSRFEDLKKRINEGRVGPANAFFLECCISLSGGEALVRQGIEGIRWQKEILHTQPRSLWMIDIVGMHAQMAQITHGLGLDAFFYCRTNPTQSTVQWLVSPDGSYTVGISSGHYSDWRPIFKTKEPLSKKILMELQSDVKSRLRYSNHRELTPDGTPYLVLGGSGDYSLAPKCKTYPHEFVQQWETSFPDQKLQFAIPDEYLDRVLPIIKKRKTLLPIVQSGFTFPRYKSFWINIPKVKQKLRAAEHLLQAGEALATVKSINKNSSYPVQDFHHSWLQLLLNMDRNTLWGAAGGMVFQSDYSWDVNDRFNWINNQVNAIKNTFNKPDGRFISFFNSCNWQRNEPVVLDIPENKTLHRIECQLTFEGKTLCIPKVPSIGEATYELINNKQPFNKTSLSNLIETTFYKVKIDPNSGNLISIVLKSSGKEIIKGHANRIVAEVPNKRIKFTDQMVDRDERHELPIPLNQSVKISMSAGSVATIVKIESQFLDGQPMEKIITLYNKHPRIDFKTTLHNVPNHVVVFADFPFAKNVHRISRAIPYGFSEGAVPDYQPNLPATVGGITPAIRWNEYFLNNKTSVALLDRGLPGREYAKGSGMIYLMATSEEYRGYENSWMNGKGEHHFEYALIARDENEDNTQVSKEAYSYNAPLLHYATPANNNYSFLQTSANVIIEAMRREADFIEIRMVETSGESGEVSFKINADHNEVFQTNMIGEKAEPLINNNGVYRLKARPQQIITIRIHVKDEVAKIQPLTDWTPLVPKGKRAALHKYNKTLKGHPPAG